MRQNFPTNVGPVSIANPVERNIESARIKYTGNDLIDNN
jgi:hypothetical protein